MGYNTKFSGSLKLSRKLSLAEAKEFLEANDDPNNIEPPVKFSGYMQWVPSESLDSIVYDGNEKFYDYDKWMQWVLDRLTKMGVVADGVIVWQGESTGDTGLLVVKAGILSVARGEKPPASNHKPLTMERLGEIALKQLTS